MDDSKISMQQWPVKTWIFSRFIRDYHELPIFVGMKRCKSMVILRDFH